MGILENALLNGTSFLRSRDLVTNRKKGEVGIFPFSNTTLWNKVKNGQFPQPVQLGENITAWRTKDIQKVVDEINKQVLE